MQINGGLNKQLVFGDWMGAGWITSFFCRIMNDAILECFRFTVLVLRYSVLNFSKLNGLQICLKAQGLLVACILLEPRHNVEVHVEVHLLHLFA